MSNATPVVRQDGEGQQMWFAGGGVFTWKATAEETGGAFLLIEDHMQRNKMTPMHLHPEQDEAIYVLEGELLADIEGVRHTIRQGGLLYAPRGVAHAFMVTSETARVLAVMVDGSGEDFYRRAGRPVTTPADAEAPADFGLLREAAERSPSITLLGPPPFEAVPADEVAAPA